MNKGLIKLGPKKTLMEQIIEHSYLSDTKLPQQTEMIVLIRSCQLAKDEIDIYTDSHYAFRVAHDFRMLCKQRIAHLFCTVHKKWTANLKTVRLHSIAQTASYL